ncbi:MAG: zinc-dependent metalloprotease, partial [Myxococcales bacterium]
RLSSNNITAADFFDDALYARALRMAGEYRCGAREELPAGDLETCKRNRFKLVRRDLMKELYRGVQLHEMGHNFGLRHNFAGSTDALNFITDGHSHIGYMQSSYSKLPGALNYWEARQRVQKVGPNQNPLQPTFLVPYDNEAMRLYPLKELQYSSIMDYGAKPNGDFMGLGKYDQAAINFGYGQLVEVFDPAAAGHASHQFREDLSELLKAGERHYTYLPYLFANSHNVSDLKKGIDLMVKGRKLVPYAQLLEQRNKDKKSAPIEVPYRFCSDEYVAGNSFCYRFDEGPDMYEMVTNIHQMYENLYWFNNFKRGRVQFSLGGSMGGYLNRIYGRYFDVLSSQYKHFVNDELIIRQRRQAQCPQSMAPTARMVAHYISPLCGLEQYAASLESLNFFAKVLARPNVGRFGYNQDTKRYEENFDSTMGPDPENPSARKSGVHQKDEINIGLGVGRFAQSAYDRERYGYSFYYKPVLIGSWWDKYIAVLALGNPYTRFIGVDANSDVFSYLINFNSLFNDSINNMVGGLVIEDFESYAPRIDSTGKLHYRRPADLYGDNPNYATMKVLDPDEQYTVRLISAFLGVAYFSGDRSDTMFTNSIKINVAGMGESPTVPDHIKSDPNKYVEIYDPNTHRLYWATRYDYYGYDGAVDADVVPLGFTLLKQIKEKAKAGDDIRQELHFVDIIRGILKD